MTTIELLNSAQFIVDHDGNKKAVVLNLTVWEEIVAALERLAALDQEMADKEEGMTQGRKRLLKAVAESRQAYEAGEVRRGTVDDLMAEITD